MGQEPRLFTQGRQSEFREGTDHDTVHAVSRAAKASQTALSAVPRWAASSRNTANSIVLPPLSPGLDNRLTDVRPAHMSESQICYNRTVASGLLRHGLPRISCQKRRSGGSTAGQHGAWGRT